MRPSAVIAKLIGAPPPVRPIQVDPDRLVVITCIAAAIVLFVLGITGNLWN